MRRLLAAAALALALPTAAREAGSETPGHDMSGMDMTYPVGKVSVGAVRDWAVARHVSVGLGGLYAVNFVPGALKPAHGDEPGGAMGLVRLKLR
jgi:hypothetical protein